MRVFKALSTVDYLDCIVFTGDLTQDHSTASYQLFLQAFNYAVLEFDLGCELYWLAGNHDEIDLLASELTHPQIKIAKQIELESWQLILVNSKSETPAGVVSAQELIRMEQLSASKTSLVFMHHHPIDVNYFIDKHGLINKMEFWQKVNRCKNVRAIFHGHVHRGITIDKSIEFKVPVYACPATSIQFDPNCETVSALAQGPGFRLINLNANNTFSTELVYLEQ